jgi:uncharacterized protein (DUF2461 family)
MPGLYFEVSHDRAGIAGGTYRPDPEQLERVRDLLMHEGAAFRAAVENRSFVEAFGVVLGEKAKIIAKEFKQGAEREPLIYNKQMYWWKELDVSVFQQHTCVDVLFELYLAQRDAQVLLESALYDGV